jgi:hypothetical protein
VGHSLLVAHGAAVKVYRDEFKANDGGEIGITLNGEELTRLHTWMSHSNCYSRRLGRALGSREPSGRRSLR